MTTTVRKSDFLSSILIFAKEKVPHFIQAKRQMRAGLKQYPYIFQKYFLNWKNVPRDPGSRLFRTVMTTKEILYF